MVFQTKGDRAASLRVQLTPDGFDSLAADNTAYLDLPESRPLRVFVPKSLVSYRRALQGIQGIQLFPQETSDEASGAFDLVMSDRPQDMDITARTKLSLGFIPPELQRFIELGTNGSSVVDWRRDAPVLQHVELADLVVLDQPRFAANAGEGDLENLGYEVLIHGQRGPLLARKQDADTLRFALLFHSDRSTLPYRVGFPIFVANVVQAALEQAGLAEALANRTGVLPPLTLAPQGRYQIQTPGQTIGSVTADDHGMVSGVAAPQTGYYSVLENGALRRRVGASLLSPGETALAGVAQIEFNEQLQVAAATAVVKTDWPLWPALLLAALGVMLIEWWFFQKKPGGWNDCGITSNIHIQHPKNAQCETLDVRCWMLGFGCFETDSRAVAGISTPGDQRARRGKISADLIPLGLRARSAAPITVEARFKWDSTRILEGRLEMEFLEGNQVLGRYRSGEMALTGGEQTFRMLLPPSVAPFSDSQMQVQMKFVTAGNAIDLEPSVLFVPTASERSLVVGWCGCQHHGLATTRHRAEFVVRTVCAGSGQSFPEIIDDQRGAAGPGGFAGATAQLHLL